MYSIMAAKDSSLGVGDGITNKAEISSSASSKWVYQQSAATHVHTTTAQPQHHAAVRPPDAGERMDEDRPMSTTGTTTSMSGVHDTAMPPTKKAAAEVENASSAISVRQGNVSSKGDCDDDSDSNNVCPLFMSGLPSDFASNPGLAAIASLLGETVEDEEEDGNDGCKKSRKCDKSIKDTGGRAASVEPRAGGGKVGGASSRRNGGSRGSTRKPSSSKSGHQPYPTTADRKEKKQKAAVGEAQLFLNMWKI
mmetsp:Transcript_6187/g.12898  ORF Transcript_6187/g.12898 Transcript_6187/m.12898 type:complete len:251 (-) Transcript_6187:108-860(-)